MTDAEIKEAKALEEIRNRLAAKEDNGKQDMASTALNDSPDIPTDPPNLNFGFGGGDNNPPKRNMGHQNINPPEKPGNNRKSGAWEKTEESLHTEMEKEKQALKKTEEELSKAMQEDDKKKKENILLASIKAVLQSLVKIVEIISDQITFMSLSRKTKDTIAQEAIISQKMAEQKKEEIKSREEKLQNYEKENMKGKETEKEKIPDPELGTGKKPSDKQKDINGLSKEDAFKEFTALKNEFQKNPYLMPVDNMERMVKLAVTYELEEKSDRIKLTVGKKDYNLWCKKFDDGHVVAGYKNYTDNQKITKEEFEQQLQNGTSLYYNTKTEPQKEIYPKYQFSMSMAIQSLNKVISKDLSDTIDAARYKEIAQKAIEGKDLSTMTKLLEYARSTEPKYQERIQQNYEKINKIPLPDHAAELFAIQKRLEINETLNLGLGMQAEKDIIKEAFEPGAPKAIGELQNIAQLDFDKLAAIGLTEQKNEILAANALDGIQYPEEVSNYLDNKIEEKQFEDVAKTLMGFAVYPSENTDIAKGYVQNFIDAVGEKSPEIGDNKYNVGLATCHLNYLNTIEQLNDSIKTPGMDNFEKSQKIDFIEKCRNEYDKGMNDLEKTAFRYYNNNLGYDVIKLAIAQEVGISYTLDGKETLPPVLTDEKIQPEISTQAMEHVQMPEIQPIGPTVYQPQKELPPILSDGPEQTIRNGSQREPLPAVIDVPEFEYDEKEIEEAQKKAEEMVNNQDLSEYEPSAFDQHIAAFTEMVKNEPQMENENREEELIR